MKKYLNSHSPPSDTIAHCPESPQNKVGLVLETHHRVAVSHERIRRFGVHAWGLMIILAWCVGRFTARLSTDSPDLDLPKAFALRETWAGSYPHLGRKYGNITTIRRICSTNRRQIIPGKDRSSAKCKRFASSEMDRSFGPTQRTCHRCFHDKAGDRPSSMSSTTTVFCARAGAHPVAKPSCPRLDFPFSITGHPALNSRAAFHHRDVVHLLFSAPTIQALRWAPPASAVPPAHV